MQVVGSSWLELWKRWAGEVWPCANNAAGKPTFFHHMGSIAHVRFNLKRFLLRGAPNKERRGDPSWPLHA